MRGQQSAFISSDDDGTAICKVTKRFLQLFTEACRADLTWCLGITFKYSREKSEGAIDEMSAAKLGSLLGLGDGHVLIRVQFPLLLRVFELSTN